MIVIEKEKYLKEEKVLVECDFKASPKCKGQYEVLYKNILKTRTNNNGKDRCAYCFNTITKCGEQNYNFKFHKNENYFENIDSEIKAYLLGWVAGDGCLKKDAFQIEIHEKDREILELFKSEIAPEVELYKRNDERGKNTICWKVHSVKIVKDLLKQLNLESVGKKAYKISLPNLDENLIWHFIRGWFDSDGWVASQLTKITNPRMSICSMSNTIRQQFMELCDFYNIKYSDDKKCQIIFQGRFCQKLIEKIYGNATFFLLRKYENAMNWKTWTPYNGTSVRSRKVREYYPPMKESQKEKIRESNRNKKRKLSDEDILEIKKMAATNLFSQKEIGKNFNVSATTICNILNDKIEIYKERINK